MAHSVYTDEVLLEMGRKNYDKLVSYCDKLDQGGFWEQAQQVMHQSSTEVLDLYVQSVLINLAVQCGEVLDEQRNYIIEVPDTNPLEIEMEEALPADLIAYSQRTCELPPILLQLCGIYDQKTQGNMSASFLDAFLNILLCMAYLNDGTDFRVNEFIQEYYEKISSFIEMEEKGFVAGRRYIHRKLQSDQIEDAVEWLSEERDRVDREELQLRATSMGREYQELEDAERQSDAGRSIHVRKSQDDGRQSDAKRQSDARRQSELAEENLKKREARRRLEAQKRHEEEKLAREEFQKVKKRLQEREQAEKEAQELRLKKLLDELNELVGLGAVKEEIQSMINLIKIRKLREAMQMPTMDMSYHMVFTGSPGTGKTTVARLLAQIYKELGVLSEGQLIETDRSGMVAGYVGQTAINVREIVEKALGGVLFIDEAYALVNRETPNDFGSEAVDTLVKLMEDHRDDLVVIVAGYTEEMKSFLKCNTGLISRFNKFITFQDYTKQELLDILEVMAHKAGLKIETDAREGVGRYLQKLTPVQQKDFGNARGIRNLFEKIVMNQANRLVQLDQPSRDQLMTIQLEDVAAV